MTIDSPASASPRSNAAPRRRGRLAGRRFWLVFGLLLVLALGVRVWFVLDTPGYAADALAESPDFDRRARSVAASGDFSGSWRPPGYPYFLGGIYAVTGSQSPDRWRRARLVQTAVGTLTVALIGLIALQLWFGGAALAAMGIAAVFPPLLMVQSSLLSDATFPLLVLAAIGAALRYRRPPHRLRWIALAGAFAGLAALTRANGLVLLLPLAMATVVPRPPRSWRALAPAAVPVCAAALVISPWTIRNAHVWGEFVPITTQTGGTLAGTYNYTTHHAHWFPGQWRSVRRDPTLARIMRSGLRGPALDRRLRRQAFDYIERHPLYVPEVGFRNTVRIFHLDGFDGGRDAMRHVGFAQRFADTGIVSFWAVGLIALLGLATRSARRTPLFVWVTPLLLLASVVFVSGSHPRFRAPVDPFIIMLAALALATSRGKRDLLQVPWVAEPGASRGHPS
jgi:4-amino-4-deoxy-L-arabinose transferase-like glycosyltransferase